jgi:hypothetical protein
MSYPAGKKAGKRTFETQDFRKNQKLRLFQVYLYYIFSRTILLYRVNLSCLLFQFHRFSITNYVASTASFCRGAFISALIYDPKFEPEFFTRKSLKFF